MKRILALVAFLAAGPAFAQDAGPVPPPVKASPAPNPNAGPVEISSQLGGVVTLTPDAGTAVTPTGWINVDGPIALGGSIPARIYARIGITSAPGATIDLADVKTYKAAEVGLGLYRVIGSHDEVSTAVIGEFSFASRIKGAQDVAPLTRLVRSAGVGLRFEAKRSGASFTGLLGYDEATTQCQPPLICTGIHSGLAFMAYGQAPIGGGVQIIADVSMSVGASTSYAPRRDVFRLGVVLDPAAAVAAIRGKP